MLLTRANSRVRGANFVEYLIIVGVIALAAIIGYQAFGKSSSSLAKTQGDCVQSMTCGSGGGSFPGASVNANGQGGQAEPQSLLGRAGSATWSFTKGVVVDGVWGTVKGVAVLGYNVVVHPIDTTVSIAQGIKYVATNPKQVYSNVRDGVVQSWNEDPARAIGNGIFQVASTLIPVTKLGTVGKVANVAEDAAHGAAVAGRGVRIGEGSFSVAYREGDTVRKVLKDSIQTDGKPPHALTPGDKEWLAHTTEEFTNDVGEAIGKGIVPPVKNVGGGVLEQKYVDGMTLSELRKTDVAAWEKAVHEKNAAINAANKRVGLGHDESGQFENGWRLKVDDNDANFRFAKDGTMTSWFDPIAIFPP